MTSVATIKEPFQIQKVVFNLPVADVTAPTTRVKALYKDFFEGYYGQAARPARQYFKELQALVEAPEHVLRIFLGMNQAWYTDAFFERAVELWREAESRL